MGLVIYYDNVAGVTVNQGTSQLTNMQIDGYGAAENGGSAYNYANFPIQILPTGWNVLTQRRFSIYFEYDPIVYLADDSLNVARGVRILPAGFPEG